MNAMTERERDFAARYAPLVWQYLRDRRLKELDFYDEVIFRYLAAVQQYLSNPKLRRYSFKTIAYTSMDSAVNHYFTAQKRRRKLCPIISTDIVTKLAGQRKEEAVAAETLLWADIATCLTAAEMRVLTQKVQGATCREIGQSCGMSELAVSRMLRRIRFRLRKVLREDIIGG